MNIKEAAAWLSRAFLAGLDWMSMLSLQKMSEEY
jgi:hypothetical protein